MHTCVRTYIYSCSCSHTQYVQSCICIRVCIQIVIHLFFLFLGQACNCASPDTGNMEAAWRAKWQSIRHSKIQQNPIPLYYGIPVSSIVLCSGTRLWSCVWSVLCFSSCLWCIIMFLMHIRLLVLLLWISWLLFGILLCRILLLLLLLLQSLCHYHFHPCCGRSWPNCRVLELRGTGPIRHGGAEEAVAGRATEEGSGLVGVPDV